MKVLFIGNSYTKYNDLPGLFEKLANENGHEVSAFSVTCGNRKLIDNIDKEDEYTEKLNDLLKTHHFDFAFLQEYSILPLTDYDLFLKGVSMLCEKMNGSVDKVVLYETWSRKEGSPVLTEHGWNVKFMTDMLADAYRRAGDAVGADVSYVGLNFYAAAKYVSIYNDDCSHPLYSGSCLAALTHYCKVFGGFPGKVDSLGLPEQQIAVFKDAIEGKLT